MIPPGHQKNLPVRKTETEFDYDCDNSQGKNWWFIWMI
jgi:hypothetical protein